MPRRCDVCGKRHKPACDEEKEPVECMECGASEDLKEHPEYSSDSLCLQCLIYHWENKRDEAESEMQAAEEELSNLKGKLSE